MTERSVGVHTSIALLIATVLLSAVAHAAKPALEKMDAPMQDKISAPVLPSMIDSLELVGVGVSLETWRNHPNYPKLNLWSAVENSNGSYIISQDAKQYASNLGAQRMMNAKRKEDAVDAAMRDFMDRYPLPIAVLGPAWRGPDDETEREAQRISNADSFVVTKNGAPLTARGEFAGLLTQSGQVMNSYLNDEADSLWTTIFATFTQHGDLPAVGVAAKDGIIQRAGSYYKSDKPRCDKMTEESFRPKQSRTLSDNWTFIALARRGRIDWLRPFAPFVIDTMVVKNRNGHYSRNWSEFAGWKSAPPKPFAPTPFIATPWTPFQIDQYDHLENLGTLHRPVPVSFLDDQGNPVNAAERTRRMEASLRIALAPLGGKAPARIFYDYGSVWDDRSSSTRFLPLVQGMHAIDADFDILAPKKGFDLARVLGDTGAGSPFVAVALASMAGRQSGGATLIANLRRNKGATLLLVTPPSREQIKKDAQIKRPYFPNTAGVKDTF